MLENNFYKLSYTDSHTTHCNFIAHTGILWHILESNFKLYLKRFLTSQNWYLNFNI